MPNFDLFKTSYGRLIPETDTVNAAGAPAYQLSPKAQLAQIAMTGCMNNTFHAQAQDQLKSVLNLVPQVEPRWLAHLAVVARRQGHMKDVPALLLACLTHHDPALAGLAFPLVIDNARMLRTYVQILRSGVVGRKSLGTAPRRWVRQWLESRSLDQLLDASVGNRPSLADIVKMVHPKPTSPEREAFFGWLLGKPCDLDLLPERVKSLIDWRSGTSDVLPETAFDLLTDRPLTTQEWASIARRAGWQWTRMNLATLMRHGVFQDQGMVELVAARLRDAELIAKARVFPYQLLVAWLSAGNELPKALVEALEDALEISVRNIPAFEGRVVVCPDVSGSMHCSVTGKRGRASSAVRCLDVSALIAAAVLRRNPSARVIPFKENVVDLALNPRNSIATNAQRLASIPFGGTDCSAPLRALNRESARADLVIFVSDNESWMDPRSGRGTATMQEWEAFRRRNPHARLACIDLVPNRSSQATSREDILNVGGFSDQVFPLLGDFVAGRMRGDLWEERIDSEGSRLLAAA